MIRHLLISIFLLFLAECSVAQQYSFINYSIEDGLAQTQANVLVQDNQGYLWIGTAGGLSRFDGLKFKNFFEEDGLIDNNISAIFQDKKNDIWVGSAGGVVKISKEKFTPITFPDNLSKAVVNDFAEDLEGNLWAGLNTGHIVKVTLHDLSLKIFEIDPNSIINVRSIAVSSNNRLIAGTSLGIYELTGNHFTYNNLYDPFNISYVFFDKDDKLWVTTYGDGIIVYKNDRKERTYTASSDGIISDWIRQGFAGKDNSYWFSSKFGLTRISNNNDVTVFSSYNGLLHDNIKFAYQDIEGNTWVATDGKGISKFAGDAFVHFTTRDGLPSDLIMGIVEDYKHNLWLATYGNGITMISERDNQILSYSTEEGISNNTIWSISPDRNGNIWAGTSNGVSIINRNNEVINLFEESGLLDNKVTCVYSYKNKMYLGSKNGVTIIDKKDTTYLIYQENFTGSHIRDILSVDGQFYFASADGLITKQGDQYVQFNENHGLRDNTVYSIDNDNEGNIWVGTAKGLSLLSNNEIINVNLGESFNSSPVNFLLVNKQSLWIGSNNGIIELNIDKYFADGADYYKLYTKHEGVLNTETNLNAAYSDHLDNLWFGTGGGLLNVNTSLLDRDKEHLKPFISINEVLLFLEPINWEKYAKNYNPGTGLPEDVVLPYNKNHLTFNFTGISLSNPELIRYQFMLEGFDEDWLPLTEDRSFTYSNLPYGSYTFKVKAMNYKGTWSDPVSFSFRITPPFYLRTWFFILIGIALVGSIYLITRFRISKIKREREQERTHYKSKLLALEQQSLNASMNRHFIFNALNSIQYYINRQDRMAANKYLSSFAKLIRKNLDSSTAENNIVTLGEELERLELYLGLESMRFQEKFEFEIVVDPLIDKEQTWVPSMFLQPFVENSIWHGILPKEGGGKITLDISLNQEDQMIAYEIIDDGIGIETSLKNKQTNANGHISRGMQITKDRINLISKLSSSKTKIVGPTEIKDNNNTVKGTKVIIYLPIDSREIFVQQ